MAKSGQAAGLTVALTGATGFVGQAVLPLLLESGHNVRALTRRPQADKTGVSWVQGALDDADALRELCAGADVVLHIAGVVNAADWAGFQAGNVDGTAHILAASKAAGAGRFIHISSLSAREPELSLYGRSKRAGEDIARHAEGIGCCIIRPPGVYGPGDAEMRDMYRSAAKGVLPMPPKGRVSLIHVQDLARLLALLVGNDALDGQIWEPDDGKQGGWSHLEFASMIGDGVCARPVIFHLPRWLLMAAAAADQFFRKNRAKLTRDRAAYLSHPDWVASEERRVPEQFWRGQIGTAQGIAQTAAWYKANGWI